MQLALNNDIIYEVGYIFYTNIVRISNQTRPLLIIFFFFFIVTFSLFIALSVSIQLWVFILQHILRKTLIGYNKSPSKT